ncbi:MAG TPA: ABC transporter ATP-binding protein [Symbiobacteriaceae bacterium]|nr:ABC transporter ATP-binding protein [Symbiobacteriaceae bacterium]
MSHVRIEDAVKRFDEVTAVAGVSVDIEPGELFTLLGPSGCGKTTLLRLLAGLETPDSGALYFGDRRVDGEPAYQRNIGMVFQNYAIFPHMSVAENVAYGLRARKLPDREVRERVAEALELVQMQGLGPRRPDQLSGGQQQRVALARALATRPAVLLMDEPLSNLDARLRQSMREEIRRLQKRIGITTIYVTHDQEEALAISDRIAVMDAGRILQVGSPVSIYRHPAHRAVAAFVGSCSFLAAEVNGELVTAGGKQFERGFKAPPAGPVELGVRPEMLKPLPVGWEPPGETALKGTVEEESFHGAFAAVRVRLSTGESVVALSAQPPGSFPPGARLVVSFRPEELYFFDVATGRAVR